MNDSPSSKLPHGLELETYPQGFTIRRRWAAGWQDWIQEGVKAILGFSLLGVAAWILLSGQFSLAIYLLCMAPISLAGLGLIYHAVVHLFNADTITATPEGFSAVHGPLPVWWQKNLHFSVQEIDKFEVGTKTYDPRSRKETENTYHTYDVVAFMNAGRTKVFVAGMYNEFQAHSIHGELMRYLKEIRPGEPGNDME